MSEFCEIVFFIGMLVGLVGFIIFMFTIGLLQGMMAIGLCSLLSFIVFVWDTKNMEVEDGDKKGNDEKTR